MSYKIFRSYAPHLNKECRIIKTGLTLKEAQEHCSKEETHAQKDRNGHRAWFDSYVSE